MVINRISVLRRVIYRYIIKELESPLITTNNKCNECSQLVPVSFYSCAQRNYSFLLSFNLLKNNRQNSAMAMSGEIQKLVNCLTELQTAKYDNEAEVLQYCAEADHVLHLIFDLCADKIQMSSENKAVIGPLLEKSLKSIEIDIKRDALNRTRINTDMLRRRSALQFLIDDFGDYPTGTSGKKFSEYFSDINELIEIMDDLITRIKARKYPEETDSDFEEGEDLPASHTWWRN